MRGIRLFESTALLTLFVTLALVVLSVCTQGRAFDRQQWRKTSTPEVVRVTMAKRLVLDDALIGRSSDEIVQLLGAPAEASDLTDWDMVYELSHGQGLFSVEPAWLVIRLSRDGRALECTILEV